MISADYCRIHQGDLLRYCRQWRVRTMKRAISIGIIAMLAMTAFTGVAAASGDENHWGVVGEQPAPGSDDNPGPGVPSPPDAPTWPPRSGLDP